jgi:adenosylhomocysteine nucleosidase
VGQLWQGDLYGQEVVVVRGGMGPERATQAATWLVQHYTLHGVLSVGFAGGLQPSLATGDAVLPLQILATTAGAETVSPCALAGIIPDARLAHHAALAATQAGLTQHQGTLLSSTEMVAHAAAKQQLGERFGAIAVDMESYSIGRVAAAHHLPFMVLRTIFDTQADEVPFQASRFTAADGALQPIRILSYVACHPHVLAQMLPAWRKVWTAGRGLESWLGHFLRRLHQPATA